MRDNSGRLAVAMLMAGMGMGIGGLPAVLRERDRMDVDPPAPAPERIRVTKPHQGKREIARRLKQAQRAALKVRAKEPQP